MFTAYAVCLLLLFWAAYSLTFSMNQTENQMKEREKIVNNLVWIEVFIILFLLVYSTISVFGQSDSCTDATPYSIGCKTFPYQIEAQECYSFTALQDTTYFDFSFIASCTSIDRIYTLYDSGCNLLDSNISGTFFTPVGQDLRICCRLSCQGGIGIRGICVSSELPVNFTSFTAKRKGNNVLLNFVTASEVNSELFNIQKSADALTWNTFAILQAGGNSTSNLYYSYTDENYSDHNPYYRVQEIDFDGTGTNTAYRYVAPATKRVRYKVYNIFGVLVYGGDTIDIGGLSPGSYIVDDGDKRYLIPVLHD